MHEKDGTVCECGGGPVASHSKREGGRECVNISLLFCAKFVAFFIWIDRGMGIVSLKSHRFDGFRVRMGGFVVTGKVHHVAYHITTYLSLILRVILISIQISVSRRTQMVR